MSGANQGGGDDQGGNEGGNEGGNQSPSTLRGPGSPAGEFQAHHGSLSDEERQQLAALQQGQPPQPEGQWQQQHAHDPQWQQQHDGQWQQQAHDPQWQQQQQAHDPQWQQQQHDPQWQQQPQQQQGQWHQAQPQHDGQWQQQPAPQQPLPVAQVGELPPTTSANPVVIAFGRAFRAAIRPEEVTEGERQKLLGATPPVTDPFLQGFLAWRKSVLLVVALFLLPVTVLKILDYVEQTEGSLPGTIESLFMVKLIVDVGFAVAIWFVLPSWTRWRTQRRLLLTLWALYFVTPFLVFLYPWRSALAGATPAQAMTFGLVFSLYAVMSLAPKAISLMPGLMRGSIAVKLLLPGSSAPGWMIALAAPMYAIFFYVILVMPYQVSGSGFFVGAMIGFTGAQVWMSRMGYRLARPESHDDAAAIIRKVRVGFHLFNAFGVLMLVIALFDFADKLDIPVVSILEVLASFIANVLLLTVLATDLLLANLAMATEITRDPSTHQAQLRYHEAIGHFAAPSPAQNATQNATSGAPPHGGG